MTRQDPLGTPRLGVRLREAAPLIAAIKRLLVEDFTLLHPERALPRPGRVTVYLCNHGPLLTPWPAPVLTADYLLAQGDYDDLVSVTLFHRVVELVPGLSPLLRRYFGHSTPALRSVAGITGSHAGAPLRHRGHGAPRGAAASSAMTAPSVLHPLRPHQSRARRRRRHRAHRAERPRAVRAAAASSGGAGPAPAGPAKGAVAPGLHPRTQGAGDPSLSALCSAPWPRG